MINEIDMFCKDVDAIKNNHDNIIKLYKFLTQSIENRQYDYVNIIIEHYSDIFNNIYGNHTNLMHIVCIVRKYDIYVYFINRYSHLMEVTNTKLIYPIVYCYSRYIINTSVEDSRLITLHYLKNFNPSSDVLISLIKYCDVTDEVVKLIVDKLSNNKDDLEKALCVALPHISVECFNYFIDCGVDINYRNNHQSLFAMACECKRFDLFMLFINFGAYADEYVLKYCCLNSKLDLVKYICENYQLNINKRFEYDTVLHDASRNDTTDIFLYLLDHPDIDVTQRTIGINNTILHTIYFEGTLKNDALIIRKLIDMGVDPYSKNEVGVCFFHYASTYEDIKFMDELGLNLSFGTEDPEIRTIMIRIALSKNIINNWETQLRDACNIIFVKHLYQMEGLEKEVNKHFLILIKSTTFRSKVKSCLEILMNEFYFTFNDTIMDFMSEN